MKKLSFYGYRTEPVLSSRDIIIINSVKEYHEAIDIVNNLIKSEKCKIEDCMQTYHYRYSIAHDTTTFLEDYFIAAVSLYNANRIPLLKKSEAFAAARKKRISKRPRPAFLEEEEKSAKEIYLKAHKNVKIYDLVDRQNFEAIRNSLKLLIEKKKNEIKQNFPYMLDFEAYLQAIINIYDNGEIAVFNLSDNISSHDHFREFDGYYPSRLYIKKGERPIYYVHPSRLFFIKMKKIFGKIGVRARALMYEHPEMTYFEAKLSVIKNMMDSKELPDVRL